MKSLARSARKVADEGGHFLPPTEFRPTKPIVVDDKTTAKFWDRVLITPACWSWLGGRGSHGYGVLSLNRTATVLAHRYSYTLHVGPIAPRKVIDHLCRNRLCVNPDHLEQVPQAVNAARGITRTTHCPRGHEYTPENTYTNEKKCKTCVRRRQRDAYHRSKGAA